MFILEVVGCSTMVGRPMEGYMPYKSNAQRRFFHAAEARGEISSKTVKEYDRASKGKKLPEKIGKSSPWPRMKKNG